MADPITVTVYVQRVYPATGDFYVSLTEAQINEAATKLAAAKLAARYIPKPGDFFTYSQPNCTLGADTVYLCLKRINTKWEKEPDALPCVDRLGHVTHFNLCQKEVKFHNKGSF